MQWQDKMIPEEGYQKGKTRFRKLTMTEYNKLKEFEKELYHDWLRQTGVRMAQREPDPAQYQFFFDIEVNDGKEVTPIGIEIDV